MDEKRSQKKFGRRDFLKTTAGVGVAAIGGYVLNEYRPWLNYDDQAELIRSSFSSYSSTTDQMREIVRYAMLAANGHNTQPWKFGLRENSIEIHPDYSRHLPIVDPDNRELWISLGCALENLLIAAHAAGYATEVTYPTSEDYIDVQITPDSPQENELYNAIPVRQTIRTEYNGQPLSTKDLNMIQNMPLEPGVSLNYASTQEKFEIFVEFVNQGNLEQYSDDAFISELIDWIRFDKKEAISTMDGLYSRCSGNPAVPRWLGQMFVSGTKPEQQADADIKKLRSSSGAVVIASETDDRLGWVQTGQVYERMALKMTSLNIKSAFLNQPIEVQNLRSQFQNALGLDGYLPQLLVRFGYAEPTLPSLRRPVEDLLI